MTDQEQDLADVARSIIGSNMYMVLGTADGTGLPWVSPLYFASAGYGEFFWVSSPEATHSRNLARRPEVSIVIFDSQAPLGTGQCVYMAAIAEEVPGGDLERDIDIFSRMSLAHGGRPWTQEDVVATAPYRLYRATASDHWVLDPASHPDRRTLVTLTGGRGDGMTPPGLRPT